MFSIYAVGVKKGYRRETRVKIHSVVDFRNAPGLDAMGGMAGGMPGLGAAMGAQDPLAGASATGVAQSDPNAIGAGLAPSTGGTVVYWRME
jgi:general secretion pathway protein K